MGFTASLDLWGASHDRTGVICLVNAKVFFPDFGSSCLCGFATFFLRKTTNFRVWGLGIQVFFVWVNWFCVLLEPFPLKLGLSLGRRAYGSPIRTPLKSKEATTAKHIPKKDQSNSRTNKPSIGPDPWMFQVRLCRLQKKKQQELPRIHEVVLKGFYKLGAVPFWGPL